MKDLRHGETEVLLAWPLYIYVEQYVKSCDTYAKRKQLRTQPIWMKRALVQITVAGYPKETIVTDILGPLPEPNNRN